MTAKASMPKVGRRGSCGPSRVELEFGLLGVQRPRLGIDTTHRRSASAEIKVRLPSFRAASLPSETARQSVVLTRWRTGPPSDASARR